MTGSFDLTGKVAAVTGAGSGLGRGYAEALAAAGAFVVVNDVNDRTAAEAVASIEKADGKAMPFVADIAIPGKADEMVAAAISSFGSFDIIVNNAGITRPAMLWKMADEEWDAVIRVNLTGVFYGVRAAAKVMREQQSGRIINITSAAGIEGSIGQINYSAAKSGVIGITKSAARELARYSVTSNAVSPVAATEMTTKIRTDQKLLDKSLARLPMGRFAEPDEVAASIVFLASDAASYITGTVLLVDGGMSM